MNENFTVTIDPLDQILSRRHLQPGGRVQMFIDNEVLKLSEQYLPFQTGDLRNSGLHGTALGSGEVQYKSPKARYLYYGKVMVGRAPKRLTSADLTYHGAPQRGAKWFERMKVNHLDQILTGAGKMAGGNK